MVFRSPKTKGAYYVAAGETILRRQARDKFSPANIEKIKSVLRPGFETPGWAYSGGQL
jgi:hypothetical protein